MTSTPDRHRRTALLLGLLCSALPSPAAGQALDSTPRITRGTCPAAHCNLGMWQSGTAVPVFAVAGAARPAFTLPPRTPFEALGSETHSIPGVHVLRAPLDVFDERTAGSLAPGDTIRTTAYLGDNRFSLEAGGRSWVAVMDENDAARLQTLRPRREVWWVRVKAADGRLGWIDGGDPGLGGVTFNEMPAPPSPALLDSALLAALTGPVAGIVRDPASRPGPPFEAPIEGARDGAGVAWERAGGLSLLQLRFRTLLTGKGTTTPELSGLPASQVVCCGNLAYHRLVAFTRRTPDYVATVTVPDVGERHVVEAFYDDGGRLVRLLRDSRAVPITYEDSVVGRAWYSAARELAQNLPVTAPAAASRQPAGKAAPARGTTASFLARNRLLTGGIVAAIIALAALGAWQLWSRKRKAARRKPSSPAAGAAAATQPQEEEGWVCSYCHADVLLDLDTCWLCGRPRETEPPQPPREFICACGEPAPPGAKSCIRCGKTFRPLAL